MNDTKISDETQVDDVMREARGQRSGSPRPLRTLFLAGLGAMALSYDRAEETFERLVERGRQVSDDVTSRTDEFKEQNVGARSRVGDSVRMGIDSILSTVNLPSKTDIDTVNVKLNILTRKLDEIQMEEAWRSAPGRGTASTADTTIPIPVPPEGDLGT